MGKKRRAVQSFTAEPQWSLADPAFAEWLRISGFNPGAVTEQSAEGLTAWYRSDMIISGTIAGLPLRVYSKDIEAGGSRYEVPHFLSSNPAGPYDISPFNWVETIVLHLLNHAESYLKSIYDGFGTLVGLYPIHPMACNKVVWSGPDKAFTFGMQGGAQETLLTGDVTQVLGPSLDGLRGMSPLTLFRRSLQTSMAAEIAANRNFTTGSHLTGLVSTEEDVNETEANEITHLLDQKVRGAENAGGIAFVNRMLKFTPWAMTNADAEFLASRRFQVEEVARIKGLPINLLSVAGAVSNWGTGIAESNLGLQKYTLMSFTSRIESALQAILPPGQFVEFDYHGLLQGTPKDEIDLLIAQVGAGILTADEARAILNLSPMPAAASEGTPNGQ